MAGNLPIFAKRDLDGFFGLAIDNLVQLLLILSLCGGLVGMTGEDADYVYKFILPGAAVSLLIGNIFYAIQAHWVARRERRNDITALPYGINTVSLLVFVFFVMKPTYDRTHSVEIAWKMGLIACLGSGIIEFAGAFFAERVRRNTPRAALLATLAGIAITFISMTFALQIWQRPLVAMVPLAVVLLVYFSHVRFPLGIPGGFVAVLLGTGLAWGLGALNVTTDVPMSVEAVREAWTRKGTYWPIWSGPAIWEFISDPAYRTDIIGMLSVIIPMGLFNVIGSLQNIESAEAGGDVFATGPSLAVNGIGTIAAALFGSCFPTTIYIGHPGWKAMGARAGYSWLNGLVMTAICLTGTVAVISRVVPMEAGMAIVLWIGIVITAQAFQASPLRHAPAAAIGLFPAIAAWGAVVVAGALAQAQFNPVALPSAASQAVAASASASAHPTSASAPSEERQQAAAVLEENNVVSEPTLAATARVESQAPGAADAAAVGARTPTMQDLLQTTGPTGGDRMELNGFLLHGMNVMERGYIFTCMILGAIAAFLIDRRFYQAAAWSAAAAVLTFLGLMHAYQLTGNVVDFWLIFTEPAPGAFTYAAYPVLVGYLLMAAVFVFVGWLSRGEQAGHTLEDARLVDSPPG